MSGTDMGGAHVVALVRDLMFGSRVRGAAPDAVLVRTPEDLLEAVGSDTALVIVELEAPGGPAAIGVVRERWAAARVVAFAPHVRAELLEAAEAAGAEALPRGAFVKRLPALIAEAGT